MGPRRGYVPGSSWRENHQRRARTERIVQACVPTFATFRFGGGRRADFLHRDSVVDFLDIVALYVDSSGRNPISDPYLAGVRIRTLYSRTKQIVVYGFIGDRLSVRFITLIEPRLHFSTGPGQNR